MPIWSKMLPRMPRKHSLRRRLAAVALCVGSFALVASGTGFGASSNTTDVSTNLIGSLSMSEPVGAAQNPICTRAVAATDTDGCADVAYAGGADHVLNLGTLSGVDTQAGSLTWRVTTTNPAGYTVRMSNTGAAPMLRGASGSIPDYPAAPISAAAAVGTTGFGVAMGDAAAAEPAVAYPSCPWVNGAQGGMFAGIPPTGITIAQRSTAVASDPFTATFAATSVPATAPAQGSYSGAVSVVASAL
jgi:hypothetical protein